MTHYCVLNYSITYNSFAESSIQSTPELKIEICKNVQEKTQIWNDKGAYIKQLPDFLKDAILFQLPWQNIKKGTVFTITAPPSSDIYIAHQEDSGWIDESLLNMTDPADRWKDVNGVLQLKTSGTGMPYYTPTKPLRILHRKTGSDNVTKLPEIQKEQTLAGIFLIEGKF